MLIKTYSSAVYGIEATIVTIEVNISSGTQYFIVGLPDSAVKESMFRIESALQNAGYRMPRQKIVINMAPANIKKEGSSYDLAIAIGILAASGQMTNELNNFLLLGELSLDGSLQPVRGILPIAVQAKKEGFKRLIVPSANAREAAIVQDLQVYAMDSIGQVVQFINEPGVFRPFVLDMAGTFEQKMQGAAFDFAEVRGQENIKRALEIAAAGGHNVILIGPPGAGKTMLAKRLPSILPPLSKEESLETTKIHSVAGKLVARDSLMTVRPFRSPHHTISDVALVGGGGNPQPGEISLAHNGVLFLDELPEFKRSVLEVLRQPLEERQMTISRAKLTVDYPASFMLIASMNPCPCGYFNHPEKDCICSPATVQKYLNKVSGPLLDRIDLHVEVTPVAFQELATESQSESSEVIRKRVIAARQLQIERFRYTDNLHHNAQMEPKQVRKICGLKEAGQTMLKDAMVRLGLSARAYDRILKVARTIADLEGSPEIEIWHLAEAIHYRSLDRSMWRG